ncbi:MAG: glycosyltransferase family 4 protein [Flavobacteriales bacterium]|nr:glycosyltransferase family 4 protein [Flavobacteriales bacterium]
MAKDFKITYITNIPSPYRVYFFDKLAERIGSRLHVIYCATNEANRSWNLPNISHEATFLKPGRFKFMGWSFYFQWDVLRYLINQKPDIVVTGGFHPTMWIVILYCWSTGVKHAINTDAWELTERSYKWYHRWMRKLVYARATYFFPISQKGKVNLVNNYRVPAKKTCVIPYVINQEPFNKIESSRKFDVLFSGQFIDRKLPLFFARVCVLLAERLSRRVKVAVLGDGPLKDQLLKALSMDGIDLYYPGFVQQEQIPEIFRSAKYFLFPTLEDGWGVVANEAVAASIPCLTNESAGAANDIIRNGENGFVLELIESVWVDYLMKLEQSAELYNQMTESNRIIGLRFSGEVVVTNLLAFLNEQ